jgi:hypothetical protein
MKSKKNSDDNLPDTSLWLPRADHAETLLEAFYKRCKSVEERILLRAKHEREMNIDNFDSGIGVEDIIRDELELLCPNRYSIRAGVIDDRFGRTAGDFEVIIFNDFWFPAVKAGAAENSRRYHYPIEGVYAIVEVKQSLDFSTLDKAMEKLVTCHRLYRPATEAGRIIENRRFGDCLHNTTNPLYSAIVVTDVRSGTSMDDLVNRFFSISETLKRKELVRALCVLGHGTVRWGFRSDYGEIKPALFMNDLYEPLIPAYSRDSDSESVFYSFMTDLFSHLYHSVLGAEDIAVAYGSKEGGISIPTDPEVRLDPDEK